jgi:hypothetical protein
MGKVAQRAMQPNNRLGDGPLSGPPLNACGRACNMVTVLADGSPFCFRSTRHPLCHISIIQIWFRIQTNFNPDDVTGTGCVFDGFRHRSPTLAAARDFCT